MGAAFAMMMCLHRAVDPSSSRTLLYAGLDTPGAIAVANLYYEGPSTEMILRRVLEEKISLKSPLNQGCRTKLDLVEREVMDRLISGIDEQPNVKQAHDSIRTMLTKQQYTEFCKLERKLEGPVILLRDDYSARFNLIKEQREKMKAVTLEYRTRMLAVHRADFTSKESSEKQTKQVMEKLDRLTHDAYQELFRQLTLEQRMQWINMLRE